MHIETINNNQNIINSKITKKKLSIQEKRYRNNISAKKHRQKKLHYYTSLEEKIKELEAENKLLYESLYELII